MSRNFVTSGSWGSGLGRPLTAAELDANTNYFDTNITTLIGEGIGVGIANITQPTPTTIKITLSNSNNYTFTLPTIDFNFRGNWVPATSYQYADVFTINNQVYFVLLAHTSSSTFDPGANDGLGHNYYVLLLTTTGSFPTGGSTDYVLGKVDGTNYNVSWRPSGVPRGGATGTILVKNSSTDCDDAWLTPSAAGIKFSSL